jgi:hypothetical protein
MLTYLNITNTFLNNYLVNFILDIIAWPIIIYVNISYDYHIMLFIITIGIIGYFAYRYPQWKIRIDYNE